MTADRDPSAEAASHRHPGGASGQSEEAVASGRWAARLSSTFLPISIGPAAIWLLLVASTLAARPPLASVDSLVLAQAWWGWSATHTAEADAFANHPPLLGWLIHAGWALFGVSQAWARLVGPLFGLGAILLAGPVARLLWPRRPQAVATAPVILVGLGGFTAAIALTLPDLALNCMMLAGIAGLGLVLRDKPLAGWSVFGLALGLALLARGSGALLYLAPLALALPWLARNGESKPGAWLLGLTASLALAALVALPWLLTAPDPLAALVGDPTAYPNAPELPPTRPWYWLLLLAPALLHPWAWWKPMWRAIRNQRRMPADDGLRLVLAAAAVAIAAGFLTEGRSAYGLVPALAPLALLAARLLTVQENKPRDYHAALPALPVLLVGLIFFLLNIVPVAHLDALWRQFVSPAGLPIWLGGTGLLSGIVLLGGAYLLGQATPRTLIARLVQLALLPALVVVSFNIEFAQSLRQFFDLTPIAQRIHVLQQSGRPVALFGAYRGEYDFVGRLERPITAFADADAVRDWAAQNPNGVVVSYFQSGMLRLPLRPLMLGAAGDNWVALWRAADVVGSDAAVLAQHF
ncbi:MAG: ArnT family glycosyltransferase [Pseudomonadota bacterium]